MIQIKSHVECLHKQDVYLVTTYNLNDEHTTLSCKAFDFFVPHCGIFAFM